MLVRVLRAGVDGTDREINAADYGASLYDPIEGLENVDKMFEALANAKDAIKVYWVVGTNGV